MGEKARAAEAAGTARVSGSMTEWNRKADGKSNGGGGRGGMKQPTKYLQAN